MQIQNELNEDEGVFFIEEDGKRLASLFYRIHGNDRLVIEHTEVNSALEGKGVGKQLVDYAVDFARTKKYKVIPLCKFAKSVFERFRGYEDVL